VFPLSIQPPDDLQTEGAFYGSHAPVPRELDSLGRGCGDDVARPEATAASLPKSREANYDSPPVSVEVGSGGCINILADDVSCFEVLEDVIHVAKEGFPESGRPKAMEAGLQPAVMMSLRVAPRISTSSM
jgi:hypothetical protein